MTAQNQLMHVPGVNPRFIAMAARKVFRRCRPQRSAITPMQRLLGEDTAYRSFLIPDSVTTASDKTPSQESESSLEVPSLRQQYSIFFPTLCIFLWILRDAGFPCSGPAKALDSGSESRLEVKFLSLSPSWPVPRARYHFSAAGRDTLGKTWVERQRLPSPGQPLA
jgi:hypothetical protein